MRQLKPLRSTTSQNAPTAEEVEFNKRMQVSLASCVATGRNSVKKQIIALIQSFHGKFNPASYGAKEKALLAQVDQFCKGQSNKEIATFVEELKLRQAQRLGFLRGEQQAVQIQKKAATLSKVQLKHLETSSMV